MVSMTAKEFCDVLIVDGVTVMVIIAMLIAYFKDGGNEMQEDNARPCNRCRNRKEYTHRGRRYKACDKWECKPDLIDEEKTPREAAGVSGEVAPVQQEKTIWDNPTHQGKK